MGLIYGGLLSPPSLDGNHLTTVALNTAGTLGSIATAGAVLAAGTLLGSPVALGFGLTSAALLVSSGVNHMMTVAESDRQQVTPH